jgi:predicted ATPase with chaperone activity
MKITKNAIINRAIEVAMVQNTSILLLPYIENEYNNIQDCIDIELQFKDYVNFKPSLKSIKIEVPKTTATKILDKRTEESFEVLLGRVNKAKEAINNILYDIDDTSEQLLKTAIERLNFNENDTKNTIEFARSIASLDSALKIRVEHIAEAIQYNYCNFNDHVILIDLKIKELQSEKTRLKKWKL